MEIRYVGGELPNCQVLHVADGTKIIQFSFYVLHQMMVDQVFPVDENAAHVAMEDFSGSRMKAIQMIAQQLLRFLLRREINATDLTSVRRRLPA